MLETPSAQNPFPTPTGGCFNLGGTLAPFGAAGVESCPPVKPGTKIFVAANAVECSTFERNGTTETELRACVQDANLPGGELVKPAVEVDRKVVPVTDVETPLLNIDLPADNILGPPPVPAGPGLSVGRGWVALLHPLTPGPHEIHIVIPNVSDITTKIVVQPGLKP